MARRSYALYVNNERLGTFRYRDGADTSQIADHLKSQHPNLDIENVSVARRVWMMGRWVDDTAIPLKS